MQWPTLLAIIPATLALSIVINVPPTALIPNPSTLPSSTHATLLEHHVKLDAPLTSANSFIFHNVSSGSYLFSVYSRDHFFENLRIDVGTGEGSNKVEAWQTFMGNEWENKGEKRDGVIPGTLEVKPVGRKDYYTQRQGCKFSRFNARIRSPN